jgi:hypothetical protein
MELGVQISDTIISALDNQQTKQAVLNANIVDICMNKLEPHKNCQVHLENPFADRIPKILLAIL